MNINFMQKSNSRPMSTFRPMLSHVAITDVLIFNALLINLIPFIEEYLYIYK